jgi:O-antigen/teichoic acid export membrane protein
MAFLRDTFITLASSVGVTLTGLLTGMLLARTLGPTGRGLMTTVLIWPQILTWMGGLSLGYANIYYGAAQPHGRRRLFANSLWAALALGSIVGVSAALVLPHFVRLDPQQHRLLTISLLLMPFGLWADFAVSLLHGTGRFDRLGVVRLAAPVVTAAGLLGLWAAHALTVSTAILATWTGSWVQTGLTLWFLTRDGSAGIRPDRGLLRRSLAYASRIHIGTLASVANARLDQLILTLVLAPRALGLYAFAVTLSELLNQAATALSAVLLPKVAGQEDEAARRALAEQSARWALLLGVLGALALYFAAPLCVRLLWGSRFVEAVPTVRVLLPGTVALGLAGTLGASLRGSGQPLAGTVAQLASLAVMTPMLLVLLPRMGIFGAGLASTCGYIVNCLVAACYFSRVFGRASLLAICPTRRDWDDLRMVFAQLRRRRRAQVAAVKS